VPLILKTPDSHARKPVGLVQLIDVMPTVLELLDLTVPGGAVGKSLLPLVNDGTEVNDYVYAGLPYNVKPRKFLDQAAYGVQTANESIRDHRWKLIREIVPAEDEGEGAGARQRTNGGAGEGVDPKQGWKETYELYDLGRDRDEVENVIDSEPGVASDLRAKLDRWVKWSLSRAPGHRLDTAVPEALIDDASRFGYQ